MNYANLTGTERQVLDAIWRLERRYCYVGFKYAEIRSAIPRTEMRVGKAAKEAIMKALDTLAAGGYVKVHDLQTRPLWGISFEFRKSREQVKP